MSDLEFKGACYACEPVAETNIKLQKRIDELERCLIDIENIVKPESEKYLISKWNMIYGRIQTLKIQEILKGGE